MSTEKPEAYQEVINYGNYEKLRIHNRKYDIFGNFVYLKLPSVGA
jgi:hypothetical protein